MSYEERVFTEREREKRAVKVVLDTKYNRRRLVSTSFRLKLLSQRTLLKKYLTRFRLRENIRLTAFTIEIRIISLCTRSTYAGLRPNDDG